VISVTIERLNERVRATRGPQFRLPKRFESASFANFVIDPAFPEQRDAISRIRQLIEAPEPGASRLPWRKKPPALDYRGVYLDGPPGIGKTHLLAAAFHLADEPKLFATFDEFSAAAGTLGMDRLRQLLGSQRLVCIDEKDLRDPGNIMLLTSLVRAMLAGRPRILATANADPTVMDAGHGFAGAFQRELGEIATAFEVLGIGGVDWRESGAAAERHLPVRGDDERVVRFRVDELRRFLAATHPMYDAAWLDEVDRIQLDRLEPMGDTDEALRFVRFIDRVYDRDVALGVERLSVSIDDLLSALRDDARFRLHFVRCRSRLSELLAADLAATEHVPGTAAG
jgi:cell division protein ZapE